MPVSNLMVKTASGRYRAADKAEILQAAGRYLIAESRGAYLSSPRAARDYLRATLGPREAEVFAVIWLDKRHRVIEFDELFQGTIDGASVHPREVVKRALARNAAACILAHNHPSGDCAPSHADELITKRLKEALALIDVRLIDHVIATTTDTCSFAERGLL